MRKRVRSRQAATAVVVCLVSVAGYLALLGWDQDKTIGADGYLHGPYEPWQVAALCAVVGVAAAWAGWRNDAVLGAVAATMTIAARSACEGRMTGAARSRDGAGDHLAAAQHDAGRCRGGAGARRLEQ
jgi:hypothetical protein